MEDLIKRSALIEALQKSRHAHADTQREDSLLSRCERIVNEQPKINAVELPCKPGDIVYMLNIDKGTGRIDAKEVSNIDVEIFSNGNVMIQVWFKTAGFCFGNHFGKTAFLDKHEAGKELIRRTIPK